MGLFAFLLLCFYKFYIYVNTSPLSDVWCGNISSHLVECLFILMIVSLCRSFLIGCNFICLLLLLFPLLLESNSRRHHWSQYPAMLCICFFRCILWPNVQVFNPFELVVLVLILFTIIYLGHLGPKPHFGCEKNVPCHILFRELV